MESTIISLIFVAGSAGSLMLGYMLGYNSAAHKANAIVREVFGLMSPELRRDLIATLHKVRKRHGE